MSQRRTTVTTANHNNGIGRSHGRKRHGKHKHTLIWLITGIGICLAGSTLATAHFECLSWMPLYILDGFAYFIHGVGAIPLLRGFEPLWALIIEL